MITDCRSALLHESCIFYEPPTEPRILQFVNLLSKVGKESVSLQFSCDAESLEYFTLGHLENDLHSCRVIGDSQKLLRSSSEGMLNSSPALLV